MARQASSDTVNIGADPLKAAMEKIEKDFGKGSVISSDLKKENLEVISTGSLGLDDAIGIGGVARGKIHEFLGWESSGKSTVTLHIIANAQKAGLTCVLVDGEQAFDKKYAKALGVDTEKLLIIQLGPGGGEACYNMAERLIATGKIGLCVFDSQTSLICKKQMEGAFGDSTIGLHARLMSQVMPKMTNICSVNNCCAIFISQFREKIGVIYGSPETTNGGHALKFYAHVRIDFRKLLLKENDEIVANKTTCKVIKNKLSSPYGKAEFRIIFGQGIDRDREILEKAVERGVIDKAGSWYSYGPDKLGQGENTILALLADNPALKIEIETKVLEKLNSPNEKEFIIYEEVSSEEREVSTEEITIIE